MSEKNKTNEIKLTRLYDAPVKVVWDAWVDPEQAAKWWGPRGFTITTHGKKFEVGGYWDYTMHGPDGTNYPNKTKYLEIKEHSKLVYDHGANDEQGPLFRVTVNFTEVDGKTKMDMIMALPTPEAARETEKFIKAAGGNATWDRLAEYLEKNSSGRECFVINRAFDAPIDLMFKMWTEPGHFSKWLAPTGMTMEFINVDIKTGGSGFYKMYSGPEYKMYGKVNYITIEKPNLIVYTQQFCDEHGNPSRHPMAPTWPQTMLTTVRLTEEGPDSTRVTVTWETHGEISAEELQTFINGRFGMTQGWTGSFDKLEAVLAG